MVVLSHPTGNQNVRQALATLSQANLLSQFHTTVRWDSTWALNRWLPAALRSELNRRSYPTLERQLVRLTPVREVVRLLSSRIGLDLVRPFSVIEIAHSIDRATAKTIRETRPKAVYAYEGAALSTFREAKRYGATCIYELPSAYWYYEIELFKEEAALRPEYAGTIAKLRDSRSYLEGKDEELLLADQIIVPSDHVKRSLEHSPVAKTKIHVIPYGAHESPEPIRIVGHSSKGRKLRVLFVGALTQRKGIGYVLDAVGPLHSRVEFSLIGRKAGQAAVIDSALKEYRWIPSLPNSAILTEMAQSDVLVLPSLSEGFALVIGEALSRGLPVITTRNSGAEEILRDGQDGFFVPIRSARAIQEKLGMLDRDRDLLDQMSTSALSRAREFSWQRYRALLLAFMKQVLN